MKTTLLAIALLLFALAPLRSTSATPQRKSAGKKEVKVYFYHDPGEYIDISPVTRLVNATSPARAAVEALLKGPNTSERKQGFDSIVGASDFRIGSLSIKDGTAKINFVSRKSWLGWSGDLSAVRFKKAVELTLKQFPTIQQVVVSLNGDTNFDDES